MFDLVLNETENAQGMKFTSLVNSPAIMVEWITFSEQQPVQFSIQNKEQRIIFGPALIPGLPIKRLTDKGELFYLRIDEANVLKTAIKFHKDGLATMLDTNHNHQLLHGVTIFETIVTSPDRVPSVKGYESLPMGTLFFSAKVNDEQVWQDILAKKYNGFSIDAMFELEPAEVLDSKRIQREITEILNTL